MTCEFRKASILFRIRYLFYSNIWSVWKLNINLRRITTRSNNMSLLDNQTRITIVAGTASILFLYGRSLQCQPMWSFILTDSCSEGLQALRTSRTEKDLPWCKTRSMYSGACGFLPGSLICSQSSPVGERQLQMTPTWAENGRFFFSCFFSVKHIEWFRSEGKRIHARWISSG